MNVTYTDNISFEDVCELRRLVGWSDISKRQYDVGFSNSLFMISGQVNGKAVSVARVVGDGGYHLAIVDVIVHPDYQGYGIGRHMLEEIMKYVDDVTQDDESTMVMLVASKGKEGFYKKFGFIERPTPERGAGMYIYYERPKKETDNG